MTDRLHLWHSPWRGCAWFVSVMFLLLLVNLPSYVTHGRVFGARTSPGLKWSGELRLCWSWWMWSGLHELKTRLSPHPSTPKQWALPPWRLTPVPSPLGHPPCVHLLPSLWHLLLCASQHHLHPTSPLRAASALHLIRYKQTSTAPCGAPLLRAGSRSISELVGPACPRTSLEVLNWQ